MERSQYILYAAGVMLFLLVAYFLFNQADTEKAIGGMWIFSAAVFVLALFGFTFLVFGYSFRSRKQGVPLILPPQTIESSFDLTQVKGIGEKRAKQLETIGITIVADLAAVSGEELAEKLGVSHKITSRWIKSAKNLRAK
ncbi:MAG: helix-hairpin-helix domain-containing protein [Candidatus Bathyarchaeia archaeon]